MSGAWRNEYPRSQGADYSSLNKDAFNVHDVDHVASEFTDLNFIVEHVGLPRLDDFCWIGVQEPNVYGGLAVAMPFIYSRPRYFAEIIGELLYWLDEDRILFSSDYAIWQPKWLVEMFVDFQIPEDMQGEYGTLTPQIKRKILGLNAARLYSVEVPEEIPQEEPVMAGSEPEYRIAGLMLNEAAVLDALSGVRDPELDEPITELKFISSLQVGGDSVAVRLRLPTPFCAPNFAYLMAHDATLLSVPGVREARVYLDDHHTADEINAGMAGGLGFDSTFGSFEETEGDDLDELRIFRRKAFVSRQERLCRALLADGYSPEELAGMRLHGRSRPRRPWRSTSAAGRSSGWTSRRMLRSWLTRTAGRSRRRRNASICGSPG